MGLTTLSVRVLEMDERSQMAVILEHNLGQRGARGLEEAWIMQALVRDDGLTQVQAAHLLGQDTSWECRRLALLEKLGVVMKEGLRLDLLDPALAGQQVRLPMGNQQAVLALTLRQTLTARKVNGVFDTCCREPTRAGGFRTVAVARGVGAVTQRAGGVV